MHGLIPSRGVDVEGGEPVDSRFAAFGCGEELLAIRALDQSRRVLNSLGPADEPPSLELAPDSLF
jgi:hypothetical protein